jgi:hypothetical protein
MGKSFTVQGRHGHLTRIRKTDLGRIEFLWLNGDRVFFFASDARRPAQASARICGFGELVTIVLLVAVVLTVGSTMRRSTPSQQNAGQDLSAGEKIPAGNEKRIPAGDGDPFSL